MGTEYILECLLSLTARSQAATLRHVQHEIVSVIVPHTLGNHRDGQRLFDFHVRQQCKSGCVRCICGKRKETTTGNACASDK